ncbi:TnsD family Tn7-like transposition protein [Burkholderia sp. AW49-1]
MTVALPLPFEDELLYNVIGRYMENTCANVPTTVIRNLFGRLVFPTVELLCGLGELARQTYDLWGLTAHQIAQRHTPLPYFTSYATDERFDAAYRTVCGDGRGRPVATLGLVATRVEGPMTFRYCEQCAVDDIARVGEAYWKRSHQLPGVFICIKHELPLQNSVASVKLRSSREWIAGNSVITSAANDAPSRAAAWVNNLDVFEVMRKSTELLTSESSRLVPSIHEHYRSLAQAVGLAKPSGLIETNAVRREMANMYGEEYLAAVGLSISAAPKQPWPVAMMLRARAAYQPLQHILLSHFLERCGRMATIANRPKQLTAGQRFTCPNQYASHAPGHIIDRVKVDSKDNGRIGRGYCGCGLKFTFSRCWPGTSEPEIKEIYAFGGDWCEAAKEMRRSGMPLAAIASDMGISLHSVKAMLKRRAPPEPKGSQFEILQWRKEWKALLDEVAPAGHKAAKKVNARLYNHLNRYDKDWLKESAKQYVQARNAAAKEARADWAGRDKKWSGALRAAAARLLAAEPRLIRASRTAIVAEADVYLLHHSVLRKLPLCRDALSELEESVEQFQLRRLERAAQDMISKGEVVLGWRLLRRAAIPTLRVTPNLMAAVSRLERECGAAAERCCAD